MSRKKTAQIISYLLSPFNNAFYAIIIIALFLLQRENLDDFTISLLLAFFFLCIMPVIGILIYTKKGTVDIWVSNQKIRTPFYLIAIIGYLIALYVFSIVDQHEFFILSLAYLFVTAAITLSNFKTKISSHTAGLTSPFTAFFYLFGMFALPFFILLPIIIWARLELNAHSISQLFGGAIIGSIITYATYFYFY
jgi:membrane-associated phospholipid phosphatase